MKWVRRILRVLALIISTGIVLVVALMHYGVAQMSVSTEDLLSRLNRFGEKFQTYTFDFEGRAISYIGNAPDPNKTLLVFVHGSPGGKDNFSDYLSDPLLQQEYVMASLDRPGYGDSAEGGVLASLEKQAAIVHALIGQYNSERVYVMGHSYGCSIILELMANDVDLIDWGILIGVAADPIYEKGQGLRKVANVPPFTWLTPKPFKVSNRELLPLKEQLESLEPRLSGIKSGTLVLQGYEDNLTPYGNATYLMKHYTDDQKLKVHSIPNEGHFILWSHVDQIIRDIISLR